MTANAIVRSTSNLSNFRERAREQLQASERRVVAAFFRLADKRVPGEWIFLALGAIALAAFLIILFFDPYRR